MNYEDLEYAAAGAARVHRAAAAQAAAARAEYEAAGAAVAYAEYAGGIGDPEEAGSLSLFDLQEALACRTLGYAAADDLLAAAGRTAARLGRRLRKIEDAIFGG